MQKITARPAQYRAADISKKDNTILLIDIEGCQRACCAQYLAAYNTGRRHTTKLWCLSGFKTTSLPCCLGRCCLGSCCLGSCWPGRCIGGFGRTNIAKIKSSFGVQFSANHLCLGCASRGTDQPEVVLGKDTVIANEPMLDTMKIKRQQKHRNNKKIPTNRRRCDIDSHCRHQWLPGAVL